MQRTEPLLRPNGNAVASPRAQERDATRVLRQLAVYYCAPTSLYVLLLIAAEVDRESRPDAQTPTRTLQWFDFTFRRLGTFFPFAALLLYAFGARGHSAKRAVSARSMLLMLFLPLTAVRFVVYMMLQSSESMPTMSDHVFLAMSVSAMLQTLLLASSAESVSTEASAAPGASASADAPSTTGAGGVAIYANVQRFSFMASRSFSLVVIFLLLANSFITFRYHHTLRENAGAVLAGGALFQLPAAAWSLQNITR